MAKQRPQWPLKVTLAFMDQFCSNFACRQLIDHPEQLVTCPLQSKAKQRPQRPLKVTLAFVDQFWFFNNKLPLHQFRSINAKVTFKGCCGLCLAFDCKGHVTSRSGSSISYLHAKFEQNRSINAKVTFKGRCGLCLAFDCKGYVTRLSRWAISYLHAKFEHNRAINSRDIA